MTSSPIFAPQEDTTATMEDEDVPKWARGSRSVLVRCATIRFSAEEQEKEDEDIGRSSSSIIISMGTRTLMPALPNHFKALQDWKA